MAKKKKTKNSNNSTTKNKNDVLIIILIACVTFYIANLYFNSGPKFMDYEECAEASVLTILDLPKAIISDGLKKLDKNLNADFAAKFNYPSSVKGVAISLMKCGNAFQVDHPNYVTGAFVICYITLQTFAIPGPIILSVLAGVFYDSVYVGVGIVACCCALGSSLCYLLSYFLGKRSLYNLIPTRMDEFSSRIESNRENLLWYMLFLRLTPLLPNWFINVASPIVGVPLSHFAIATFLGTTPANVVYYYAGTVLKDQGEFNTSKGYKSIIVMTLLAVLSLVPTMFKKQIANMEKEMGSSSKKKAASSTKKKFTTTKKRSSSSNRKKKSTTTGSTRSSSRLRRRNAKK